MSEVSAQAFREAAAFELELALVAASSDEADARHRNARLLLAAAEQCEQLDKVKDDRETLELKLAACTAAALGNTDTTVQERIEPGHPYYSATYGDVCRAVDREMDSRAENVGLKTIVELLHAQIATLTAERDEARTLARPATSAQIATVRLSTGRFYLNVASIVAAVEGDPCRDSNYRVAAWDRSTLDSAAMQINAQQQAEIDAATHERDLAGHAKKIAGDNPLDHELLDLVTLMPDRQTQQILDYILELRAIRARK